MNSICKKYIRETKAMFPVKGKAERAYLKNLAGTIDEFTEENGIKNIDTLYEEFGNPIDTAKEYFSARGTPYIMKKLKMSKYIKVLIIAVICAIIAFVTTYGIHSYLLLQSELRSEIASVDEEIEIIDSGEISNEEFEQYIQNDKSFKE